MDVTLSKKRKREFVDNELIVDNELVVDNVLIVGSKVECDELENTRTKVFGNCFEHPNKRTKICEAVKNNVCEFWKSILPPDIVIEILDFIDSSPFTNSICERFGYFCGDENKTPRLCFHHVSLMEANGLLDSISHPRYPQFFIDGNELKNVEQKNAIVKLMKLKSIRRIKLIIYIYIVKTCSLTHVVLPIPYIELFSKWIDKETCFEKMLLDIENKKYQSEETYFDNDTVYCFME